MWEESDEFGTDKNVVDSLEGMMVVVVVVVVVMVRMWKSGGRVAVEESGRILKSIGGAPRDVMVVVRVWKGGAGGVAVEESGRTLENAVDAQIVDRVDVEDRGNSRIQENVVERSDCVVGSIVERIDGSFLDRVVVVDVVDALGVGGMVVNEEESFVAASVDITGVADGCSPLLESEDENKVVYFRCSTRSEEERLAGIVWVGRVGWRCYPDC